MIDVKEAVQSAKNAAKDFLAEDGALEDLLLEEVEFHDAENTWLITLGFNVVNKNALRGIGAALAGNQYIRKYKAFSIDADTGKVKAMKIREV
jgi:hypothetical protein